jgi:hypothetical protein
MLIELEPAKPGFDRYRATSGFDDFLQAAHRWEEAHVRCGDGVTTGHLGIDERSAAADGVRRVWFYCCCGRQRLVLGPPHGGEMRPLFPRVQ